ncbi:hypothetical protein T01_12470 [Trichinella spiralis]|uniref:Uncharacterized protein n=1 Tax=Trichinella spiralis TaxID=6334 RepID=A0A0V1C2X3_TRISP|nr:hypothetical protein T01_12470 [Trichinella spiralis]
MEKIVTFKNLTYEALTAKAPGWRTFFKVKHSMELGFLKTTRSCCHYENFTYIFQLNHQQMSMKVCRQLEHCEQLKWCEKLGREDRRIVKASMNFVCLPSNMYCEVLIASNSRPNKNASNDVSLSSNELYSMVSTTGNCKKLM